jgi:quercetin dioxygenase-like cupin family protein
MDAVSTAGDIYMKFSHNHFENEGQAREEIKALGLYELTTDVPAQKTEVHWHDHDSVFFILDGELEITVADTGKVHRCTKGSRVETPTRFLHSENTPGFRVVMGLSVAPDKLTKPVNKPADELTTRGGS